MSVVVAIPPSPPLSLLVNKTRLRDRTRLTFVVFFPRTSPVKSDRNRIDIFSHILYTGIFLPYIEAMCFAHMCNSEKHGLVCNSNSSSQQPAASFARNCAYGAKVSPSCRRDGARPAAQLRSVKKSLQCNFRPNHPYINSQLREHVHAISCCSLITSLLQ